MKESLQQTLINAFDYLITSTLEGARPEEARARFRLFQKQHPETEMDLIWKKNLMIGPYTTTSCSISPERGLCLWPSPERSLPWPMRGVQRLSEGDLVRVNNEVLNISQVIVCLILSGARRALSIAWSIPA